MNPRHSDGSDVSSRSSIPYHVARVKGGNRQAARRYAYFGSSSECHMLYDDMAICVLNGLAVEMQPADAPRTRLIANAFESDGIGALDAEHALREVLRRSLADVLVSGEALFELELLPKDPSNSHTGFRLHRVQPATVVFLAGYPFQVVPRVLASHLGEPRWKPLPRDRIVRIRVAGTRKAGRLLDGLSVFDDVRFLPGFVMQQMARAPEDRSIPFDQERHHKAMDSALARATSPIGWTARSHFEKRVTQYYMVYRRLRFLRFCVETRDALLTELRFAIENAFRQVGLDTTLIIRAQPALARLVELEQMLAEGCTLEEVNREVRLTL